LTVRAPGHRKRALGLVGGAPVPTVSAEHKAEVHAVVSVERAVSLLEAAP